MARVYVDYASPVELTTLTGLSTLPGGHVCTAGERILTYGEDDTNVGIWVVADPGAWVRATDFDETTEVVFDTEIVPTVSDGASGIQAGSIFYVATTGTITPGTTAFAIVQRSYEEAQTAGIGLVKVGSDWQQSTTGVIAGSYDRVTVDERGSVTGGSSSNVATTFIEGLRLVWLSNTSFRIEAGAAYINDPGAIVDLPVDMDIAAGSKGLPATFSVGFYYVYLYSNAGVGDIEVSTQSPATTPYRGAAREKGPDGTIDSTRRFIGTLYAATTTTLRRFRVQRDGWVRYITDHTASPYRVVSLANNNGTAQDRDCSAVVPPTSTSAWAIVKTNATSGVILGVSGEDNAIRTINSGSDSEVKGLPLSSARQFRQINIVAGGSTNIDIAGYLDAR